MVRLQTRSCNFLKRPLYQYIARHPAKYLIYFHLQLGKWRSKYGLKYNFQFILKFWEYDNLESYEGSLRQRNEIEVRIMGMSLCSWINNRNINLHQIRIDQRPRDKGGTCLWQETVRLSGRHGRVGWAGLQLTEEVQSQGGRASVVSFGQAQEQGCSMW